MVANLSANSRRTAPAPASPPPSLTSAPNTSASRPAPTPIRAMWKPSIASLEDEFFDLETFRNRAHFMAKASLYQLYFNLARPNSHKEHCTPCEIIHQLHPLLPLDTCLLPPLFLDYRLNSQGGYDVPRYPCSRAPLLQSSPESVTRKPSQRADGNP